MVHTTRTRWIWLATVTLGVVAVGATAIVATSGRADTPNAVAANADDGASHSGSDCTDSERKQALAQEQRRVLESFADVRVLRTEADLTRLSQFRGDSKYSFPSHAFNSILGMGVAIANVGAPKAGQPHLLLYRPNPDAVSVTDPWGVDLPYELVGWGYGAPYNPQFVPSFGDDPALRCLVPTDWFIHERSVHPNDTWQNIAVPPKEDFPGQVTGGGAPRPEECKPQCVGMPHPRLWDIHFWADPSGVPVVSMLNPGPPIPGFDPGKAFFHPPKYPSASSTELWPHPGHPQ